MQIQMPRLSPAQRQLLVDTFSSQRDYRGSKHSTARSLTKRGLFVFEISGSHGKPCGGYALTPKGIEVAQALVRTSSGNDAPARL